MAKQLEHSEKGQGNKGTKTVEGGAVQFTEGHTQGPDSIDQVVQPTNNLQTNNGLILSAYYDANMQTLASGNSYSTKETAILFSLAAKLASTVSEGCSKLSINNVPSIQVKKFLESNPRYGPEIAQTGIYEAAKLDQEFVSPFELVEFFPEIKEITDWQDSDINIRKNPYQYILCLPTDSRAFISGAVKTALETSKITEDNIGIHEFYKPLSVAHFLDYAKIVAEVPKVAEYFKIYSGKK